MWNKKLTQMLHFDLLPCCFLLLLITTHAEKLREIRLQGFIPMTGTQWPIGGACLPATLMALRHVNERTGLLDGYNITYSWADSKCHAGKATYEMFRSLSQPPVKNMLLGCACSVASEPTAQVSHLFNLTQISYASTSPSLSDRKRFPNFFQLDNPDHAVNPAKIEMMRDFNWKKVATINQAIEYHSMVIEDFVKSVEGTDITIITQELFHHDPYRRVENLKKHDARIIITALYEDKARLMMCAAYKLGLYGPKIVWIFYNWLTYDFWRPRNDVSCTADEMKEAIEGAFLMGSFVRNPIEERGIAGITEFDQLYRQEEMYDPVNDKYYHCAPFSYDHIWIAALALDCTENYLRAIGHPKYLDEFTYKDSDINDVIMTCMSNMSLVGVSGRIEYRGEAIPATRNIKIERVLDDRRVLVGTYTRKDDLWKLQWVDGALKWHDNNIPRDSTFVQREGIAVPRWLYVTLSTCAGVGILCVIGCLIFNTACNRHRIVHLSSPHVNNVMLAGCVLTYSTVFMTVTQTQTASICKARTVCFSIGFTIAVGALFFKTWRMYKVFADKKIQRTERNGAEKNDSKTRHTINKLKDGQDSSEENPNQYAKAVQDIHLIGLVFSPTSVIAVLLAVWEIISPQDLREKELVQQVYTIGNDVEVRPFVHICYFQNGVYFSWTIYIIEGLLLLLGSFLAWETRNVKVEAFSDSRQIGISVYNTMVLSAFGFTVSLLLEDEVVVVYRVTSGCIILGTALNQSIIFVPKVLLVYRQKPPNNP